MDVTGAMASDPPAPWDGLVAETEAGASPSPSSECGTEDMDDEDSEPLCYFYLAKHGFMSRGVGAAREPPGVPKVDRKSSVAMNRETNRPVAPAGQDDSTVLERCVSNAMACCSTSSHNCVGRNKNDSKYKSLGMQPVASLTTQASITLGRHLKSNAITAVPPFGTVDEHIENLIFNHADLDARTLALAFACGVTKLHIKDFDAILSDDHIHQAWRCYHEFASVTTEGPPIEGHKEDDNSRINPQKPPYRLSTPVPSIFVKLSNEGVPIRERDPKVWLKVFENAFTLKSLALESGVTGEGEVTETCLRVVLQSVIRSGSGMGKQSELHSLSVAYFDCVDDETLASLWPPVRKSNDRFNKQLYFSKHQNGSIIRARKFEILSVVEPPGLEPVLLKGTGVESPGLANLTTLHLSHLPEITDATVLAALDRLPKLKKLRLEFLGVTDACIGSARPGGWHDALSSLHFLEIKSCPYVRFAHPGVDFKHPPNKLKTLRIQPGGEPRRSAGDMSLNAHTKTPDTKENGQKGLFFSRFGNASTSQLPCNKPKGGRADMSISARHVTQLAFSKSSNVTHLCLGARFAGTVRELRKLGLKGNTGGYRADDLLDLRAISFPTIKHLEVYRNETQIIWPRSFRKWSADTLTKLTVETPSDNLAFRLIGVTNLKHLHVCDFRSATVEEFRDFALLGGDGEGALNGGVPKESTADMRSNPKRFKNQKGKPKKQKNNIETFIAGGVRDELQGHVEFVTDALARTLLEGHFHVEPEYPTGDESIF